MSDRSRKFAKERFTMLLSEQLVMLELPQKEGRRPVYAIGVLRRSVDGAAYTVPIGELYCSPIETSNHENETDAQAA